MKFEKIFNIFSKYVELSDSDKEYFESQATIVKYKKGQILFDNDQDCKFLWYINEGYGRYFWNNPDGTQTTTEFFGKNDFVTDFESFFYKKKTFGYIEAVSKLEAVMIPQSLFNWFFANIKNADKLRLDVTNHYLASCIKRIDILLEKNPLLIFKDLILKYPEIEQIVSQKVIASYLNITPVHLSRLKSQFLYKDEI